MLPKIESTPKDRKEANMVNLYSAKAGTWILQVLSYKIARVPMSCVQNKTKSQALDSKLQNSQQGTEDHDKESRFQREIDIKTLMNTEMYS
jgi:hypothetical protein